MGAGFAEQPGDAALGMSAFGKYRLIASLGQGGMANVYLAVVVGPAGFNKLLVVKALREDVLSASDEFVHMFLDEARLSARLNHPNIVQTYEIGHAEGRYFIAMEYLEGQPLRVAQRRLGAVGLPLEEELRIIAETAHGLHYAHELKGLNGESLDVVHRDVSPQNVFLTYEGGVKLLDFGIAKALDAQHLTKVGTIKGKLDYIAPEQIRGEKIDRRADVFALGVMLWEAATGQRFAGGSKVSDAAKLQRRLAGGEPKLRELKPELPDQLVYIIERALSLDPNERQPTAAELADELEAFLESMGMRPSAKTLSGRLGAPFAAERAKIGWLIEEQVKLARQDSEAGRSLPSIGRNELSQSNSGVRGQSLPPPPHPGVGGRSVPPPPPPSGNEHAAWPAQPQVARESLMPAASVVAESGMRSMRPPAPPVAAPARPSKRPGDGKRAFVWAFVAAATLGASAFLYKANQARLEQQALAAAATATAGRPRVAAEGMMLLHVFVLPENAHATLDGVPLPELPFTAEVPLDGKMHHVEASAPGYRSKHVVVSFDHDRELSVVLDRLPPEQPMPRARRKDASSQGSLSAATEQAEPRPKGTEAEAAELGDEAQKAAPQPGAAAEPAGDFLQNPYDDEP